MKFPSCTWCGLSVISSSLFLLPGVISCWVVGLHFALLAFNSIWSTPLSGEVELISGVLFPPRGGGVMVSEATVLAPQAPWVWLECGEILQPSGPVVVLDCGVVYVGSKQECAVELWYVQFMALLWACKVISWILLLGCLLSGKVYSDYTGTWHTWATVSGHPSNVLRLCNDEVILYYITGWNCVFRQLFWIHFYSRLICWCWTGTNSA